jgi:hypothetical protein
VSDLLDVKQLRVPLSALEATKVGPIQASHFRKFFLRHIKLPSLAAYGPAKPDVHADWTHCGSYFETAPLVCPRTMNIIDKISPAEGAYVKL